VTEGATDAEILNAYDSWPIPDRRWLESLLRQLRGEEEGMGSSSSNSGDVQRHRTLDEPLRQQQAIDLINRWGSTRKAAKNSAWTYSHISRVARGERGKGAS
jgi:hypothetical protein